MASSGDDSKNIIYKGANISQLAYIFQKDNRTIAAKIHDVQPSSVIRGHKVYQIRDVAPYLVKPAGDMESYLKRMNHADLPPMLSKEFWNGQIARQKFEENQGDLWRTEKVVSAMSDVIKDLRMSLLLLMDRVEREEEFTIRQREVAMALVDEAMNEMADNLISRFKDDPDKKSKQPAKETAPAEIGDDDDDIDEPVRTRRKLSPAAKGL